MERRIPSTVFQQIVAFFERRSFVGAVGPGQLGHLAILRLATTRLAASGHAVIRPSAIRRCHVTAILIEKITPLKRRPAVAGIECDRPPHHGSRCLFAVDLPQSFHPPWAGHHPGLQVGHDISR